jgi:hypothetical protein
MPNGDNNTNVKQYFDRVRELVPAEITAAFLAINTAIPLDSSYLIYLWSAFGILLVACWLHLRILAGITNIRQALFVTLVAFPVWALNISVSRFDFLANATFVPSCALVIVTVLSPVAAGPKKSGQA